MRQHSRPSLVVPAAVVLLVACATNPATGKRQLSLVSEKEEIALGQQSKQQVLEQMGAYPDPKLQAYVESVGKKMALHSERPNLPWSFTVVDDPAVNAFALPGGPIFITRGILGYLNTEAELASVLGHEIGHVTARHSVQQMSKAQLAQLGLGVGMIVSPELAGVGQAASAGLQLLFLKFGRDDERQADELGFRYMVKEDYDPRQADDMFVTLKRSSDLAGGGRVPEWTSTHPDPENRAEAAEKRAATVPNADKMNVGRDVYLAHVNGIVFGDNPRQGYFQGNSFLHPDLKFRIDFPDGWKKQNTASAVVAASPKDDAAIQLVPAGKMSPQEAAQKFLSQEGVKAAQAQGSQLGALPPSSSYFEAQTQQGAVRGIASFLSHGGQTFGILSYTAPESLSGYDAAFRKTIASFGPLNDPAALAVQPAKIELVKVPRQMTLAEFNAQFPSSVPVEQVAVANGLDPKAGTFKAGETAKRIVGGAPPASAAAPKP
ncbi:MAG TPA: M48 family metalloprotease [Anaeromyxobacteraceae bacterium]|nr:M48 family metalloprotease [Anaeromyxobacteraceae bacterium]